MSSTREAILVAFQTLLAADPFFPPAAIDEPEPSNFRTPVPGENPAMGDYLSVQDGPLKTTRDGGAADDFELELEVTLAYAVVLANTAERRARRDAAMQKIVAIVAANRTLGLGDPQIYAEIADAVRDDNVPVKAAAAVALLLVTVTVQFIAPSAAG